MSQVTQTSTGTRHAGPATAATAAEAPTFERISHDELATLASQLADKPLRPASTPVMELTARNPYDAARGNIDVFKPGRWDTSSNLIYMDSLRQVGDRVGEWDGSQAYVSFAPPAAGTYVIVGHFTGYQTTMHLNGPWGTNTAYTAQTSDAGAVLAIWSGNQKFQFTLNCTVPDNGWGIGYLESIQVLAVA